MFFQKKKYYLKIYWDLDVSKIKSSDINYCMLLNTPDQNLDCDKVLNLTTVLTCNLKLTLTHRTLGHSW